MEVGPSDVLSTMMKRTWEAQYSTSDSAKAVNRRIIGPKRDIAEIYYRADPEASVETSPITAAADMQKETVITSVNGSDQAAKISQAPPLTVLLGDLPDTHVPAAAILLAIIGTKLKRHPSEINIESTISSLVGGKMNS